MAVQLASGREELGSRETEEERSDQHSDEA